MRQLLPFVAVVSLVVAGLFLPHWATLVVLAAWVIAAWLSGKYFQRALDEGVSRSHGFVLRDATVLTDEVVRDDIDDRRITVKVELTITPRPGNAQFRLWQPERLRIHLPGDSAALPLESIDVGAASGWSPGPVAPVKGKQRLRLTFSAPPDTPRVALRYFLEDLADIDLVRSDPEASAVGGAA